ncbi:MAG: protein translocase subunit SecDF [Bacteroidales bacterium]|nr:protein translocase subunit SecDF [Bacteroidales bacterium]
MRNKGAILFLTITVAVVISYHLSFTVVTSRVKKAAAEYAQGDLIKESNYVDSIASLQKDEWSFLGNTYKECQEKELNLGLDLKGGMNVILEISVVDIIQSLSNYSTDTTFVQAVRLAQEKQKDSQEDFVTLFGNSFEEIDPNARLAAIFNTIELKSQVDFNSSNQDVLKVIRNETESAVNNSFNILESRINRFGVAQPSIQLLGSQGRIMVELPGVKDTERVRKLLQGTANLEFWETYENGEVAQYLIEANARLKVVLGLDIATDDTVGIESPNLTEGEQQVAADDTSKSLLDLMESDTVQATDDSQSLDQFKNENPLFAVLYPNTSRDGQFAPGSVVGYSHYRDTAKVNAYFKMEQIAAIFPRDLKFVWHWKPYKYDDTQSLFEFHAVKITTRDGRAPLAGDVITGARDEYNQTSGDAQVSMNMNTEGSKVWARMTRENIGKCIAIVLDDYVRSAPRVSVEIKGGSSEITGDFTIDEAKDLANILKSGKLPAPARIEQETIVGPSLGQEAIDSGLNSFMIAFVIVLLYMVFYYSYRAGSVADIALIINMFFLMGVLASLGAVLTLPGIAGIVLTIGMSVDANVLIYERIKEELRAGKGIKLAIKEGYKNAYSAIIDANVTTLLTAGILFFFGTGPIKGFATTLGIGIITSLFSAIFITRLIFEKMLDKNMKLTFATKLTENAFSNMSIKFISKRKVFYVVSGALVIISIISLLTRGLNPSVDFTGGRTYIVRFEEAPSTVDVQNNLKLVFGEAPEVKIFGNDRQLKITTQFMIDDSEADDTVEENLYEGLLPIIGDDVSKEEFLSDYRQSSQMVGPTIADDIKVRAVWVILLSLIVMFVYIVIRFRNWQFGMGAVAALVHDSLIVLGVFSLFYGILPFSLEIDQAFIAAILTVMGYSVNDTVVVYDRIREYVGLYRKRERSEIMDIALNSTLSRTLSTSLSTFLVLLTIFIFGGEVIRGFTFALMVGVVVGTYSSLFVATPMVYDTVKKAETTRVLKAKKRS